MKRLLSGDCEDECGSYDLPIDSQEGHLRLACAPQTNDSLSSTNTTTTRPQHDSLWKLFGQCVYTQELCSPGQWTALYVMNKQITQHTNAVAGIYARGATLLM
ncbi:hypothetical protein ACO0QE_002992 [Hanseniaspora vineae]